MKKMTVSDLREGDRFLWQGATLTAWRVHGWGGKRMVHLEAWRQGEGTELQIAEDALIYLVSRLPDEELAQRETARRENTLRGWGELMKSIDEAADEPDPEPAPTGFECNSCGCLPERGTWDVVGVRWCVECLVKRTTELTTERDALLAAASHREPADV